MVDVALLAIIMGAGYFISTSGDETSSQKSNFLEEHQNTHHSSEPHFHPYRKGGTLEGYITFNESEYILSNQDTVPTKKTQYRYKGAVKSSNKPQHLTASKEGGSINPYNQINTFNYSLCGQEIRIYFDYNIYSLNSNSKYKLLETISNAKSCNVDELLIQGYATIIGGIPYNVKLAAKRANSVKEYFLNNSSLNVTIKEPVPDEKSIAKERYASIVFIKNNN